MKNTKKTIVDLIKPNESDFVGYVWDESWTYIKTMIDIMRESVLVLSKDLKVMLANESFYRTFQVEHKNTENQLVYELGNGQWNIPSLKKLLENILPNNTFFKGFEIDHEFPIIGRRLLILNARKINPSTKLTQGVFPAIILLAIEDITDIMVVAETLANHTAHREAKHTERTEKLEKSLKKLTKEINVLKNRV